MTRGTERRYRPPAYAPASSGAWHHFLFGHVPGWQLDFIVQPELRGTVQRHHTAALRPLFAKLDPRVFDTPCYAIGNLSLHQDEEGPGCGALAVLYGQRFGNLSDHAGRPGAFFSHAAVVAGRQLQPQALATAMRQFGRTTLAETNQFFQRYYSMGAVEQDGQIKPRGEDHCVMDYLRCFAGLENLPPAPSRPEILVPAKMEDRPTRILVLCHPQQPRESKLILMAELASALFHSHVPWVWITLDVLPSVSQQSEAEPKQLVIHLISQTLCPASIQESLDSNTLVVQFEHTLPTLTRVRAWLTTGREATTHSPNERTGRRPKKRLVDSRWPWPLFSLALLLVALVGLLVWSLHRPNGPVRKPADILRAPIKTVPPDQDQDGVLDHEDICPRSAAGKEPDPKRPGCPLADVSTAIEQVSDLFVIRTNRLRFSGNWNSVDESDDSSQRIIKLLARYLAGRKDAEWQALGYAYQAGKSEVTLRVVSQVQATAVLNALRKQNSDLRLSSRVVGQGNAASIALSDTQADHIVLCSRKSCP